MSRIKVCERPSVLSPATNRALGSAAATTTTFKPQTILKIQLSVINIALQLHEQREAHTQLTFPLVVPILALVEVLVFKTATIQLERGKPNQGDHNNTLPRGDDPAKHNISAAGRDTLFKDGAAMGRTEF